MNSPLLPPSTEADRIAVEQILHWVAEGITPTEALRALGYRPPSMREPNWHDVQYVLSATWNSQFKERPDEMSSTSATDADPFYPSTDPLVADGT